MQKGTQFLQVKKKCERTTAVVLRTAEKLEHKDCSVHRLTEAARHGGRCGTVDAVGVTHGTLEQ
jgi:hypothetical protein